MAPQALPERVASPPCPRQACRPRRSARSPPRLWSTLPAETQKQIAQAVAGLIRRMQAGAGAPGTETTYADGLERR
jgi:hypothetical protein